ncbi:DUF4286 family protein [Mucilaginibacter aquatilis]|uniref:DUF4286 family protein n=1 Tax=Mucilaginibacter aquatilis TaxID=1517760 RepID=A0A6I4I886_9SPHI|nr:DUF4286 family protein [Mucilaginibacter aquatilis]MVN90248.1 DUF4286 family protein [Mucilaginibacter aquatilis]
MIIYNETFVVDAGASTEWLQWMKQEHIPAAMQTACFTEFQILEIIDSPNEGATFCIQYKTPELSKFEEFKNQHLQALHVRHHQQFENRYVLFNSIMKTVD